MMSRKQSLTRAADMHVYGKCGRGLANALELAKRAVNLQALPEVLGGLCIEKVAFEAANVSRMDMVRGMSRRQALTRAADAYRKANTHT